ncbi:MAG: ACT domain-containing protein [Oscillospiraceae bacterium]|nr:ACT domain-containing protein [Oscillospiraceae bacterium]
MLIKQLSVFVENRPGRLSSITRLLGENDVDIRALSIADTRDFGILRLIVNNPDKALEVLKGADYSVTLTNVIAIGIEDKPGGLAKAMEVLYQNGISVEYMYAFISKTDNTAFVILRVENSENAAEVLQKNGIKLLTSEEIYKM